MKIKFIILIINLFIYNVMNAQVNFSGVWNGTLNVAGELHLVLHVTLLKDGTYSATLDSPDQHVAGNVTGHRLRAITGDPADAFRPLGREQGERAVDYLRSFQDREVGQHEDRDGGDDAGAHPAQQVQRRSA